MTKFLLTTALSILIVFSAYSANALTPPEEPNTEVVQQADFQPKLREHRGMREHLRPEKMDEFLNLTEEQKAKAKEIREQSRQEIEPLMKEMKALREKMDKIREADMQKFEALLTPEQKSKLDAAKQKREEMHKNSGKHGFMPHGHRGLPKSENIEGE